MQPVPRFAAFVISTLIAAPLAAEIGVSPKEIVIGSCSDRTGTLEGRSTEQLQGGEAYFRDVNEHGGVHGRTIRLEEYNDGYDPINAVGCFKRIIDAGSFAGAFFVGSPMAAKYVLLAEDNKIPVLGFISGAQFIYEPTKHYVFAVRASSLVALRDQVKHLWADLGVRKFAVIYQSDAYGAHVLESARLALKEKSVEPVEIASYERGSVDVQKAVDTIQSAQPEAVFLGAVGVPMAEIVKASKAKGFNPYFLTISDDPAFYKEGGRSVEGTIVTQFVPSPQEKAPTAQRFLRDMAKYFPESRPSFTAFEGYLDALVLVDGIKRAGPELTRDRLISALESMHDVDLGIGEGRTLSYGPNDHHGFNFVFETVVKDGQPVPLRDWKTLKK